MSGRKGAAPLTIDTLERFVVVGDCWLWNRYLTKGYGHASVPGRRTHQLAHRAVWELLVGPIPDGLELDHLCRVRSCVNPDHLEPVTPLENTRRAPRSRITHCIHGHQYTEANTYRSPRGRICRTCQRVQWTRRREAAKAESL
jgi:hypothetical protein